MHSVILYVSVYLPVSLNTHLSVYPSIYYLSIHPSTWYLYNSVTEQSVGSYHLLPIGKKLWRQNFVEKKGNILFKVHTVWNNGRFLPQSPFPLKYPKKITLPPSASSVQGYPGTSSSTQRYHSLRNIGGLAGFQLLPGFRHPLESVHPGFLLMAPAVLFLWLLPSGVSVRLAGQYCWELPCLVSEAVSPHG